MITNHILVFDIAPPISRRPGMTSLVAYILGVARMGGIDEALKVLCGGVTEKVCEARDRVLMNEPILIQHSTASFLSNDEPGLV